MDVNWKFWSKFFFCDMLSLYLSMQGGLWDLWLGGIKYLTPLFASFGRPYYQKLIT